MLATFWEKAGRLKNNSTWAGVNVRKKVGIDPLVFPQLEEGVSSCPSPGIQVPPTFLDCTGTLQGHEGNVDTLNWSEMEPSHGGTARSCWGWRPRTWLGGSGVLSLGYWPKG